MNEMNAWQQVFAIGLPAGLVAGGLYFAAVWRSARQLSSARDLRRWWLAAAGRFLALAGVLALIATHAPAALLGVLPGMMLARTLAIRTVTLRRPLDTDPRRH